MPKKKYGQIDDSAAGGHDLSTTNTSYNPTARDVEAGSSGAAAATAVDRHTSVRSIMTLPAYNEDPQETEQVLGREGERAGMDTVVEFPETAEEQEAQRDGQMESLYQIRLARRREIAEREQRKQERREARNRGDFATLERLRRESQARSAANSASNVSLANPADISAATLLAEHQSRGRERRVSAVTYASVGHVRHDGSRLRANSDDSERGALLDGAAPMGGRNRGISDVSVNSGLSISTTGSDPENPIPGQHTPLTHEAPRTSIGSSGSSPTANRYTPDDSTGSDDIGESRIPPPENTPRPPDYDNLDWGEAPAYEPAREHSIISPQQTGPEIRVLSPISPISPNVPSRPGSMRLPSQAPRLPSFGPLPSITIESATPASTPILSQQENS